MATNDEKAPLLEKKALEIVVIGGSLAGLMHAVMLKRLGHNVHLLEQSPATVRGDEGAGISSGPDALAFFQRYDLTKLPYALETPGFQFLDGNAQVKRYGKRPMQMSSWSMLYYRLRANFDGHASALCSEPPAALPTDGQAFFDIGKQVTGVTDVGSQVRVEFNDLTGGGGQQGSLLADLVIAADGANSGVRRMLLPSAKRSYAGYFAWRGMVPESELSEETRNVFGLNMSAHMAPGGYILCYLIPGKDGSLEVGRRRLNFVWYTICPSSSDDFSEIMTDTDGQKHRNTLPIGKMRPEIWAKQQAIATACLAAPYAELVNKTTKPFISAVQDCIATQASFCNGKVLLVGDALTLFRPHMALSCNQCAVDCLALEKVMRGEMSVQQWERKVLQYGYRSQLLNIAFGNWFLVGKLEFLASVSRYLFSLLPFQPWWRA